MSNMAKRDTIFRVGKIPIGCNIKKIHILSFSYTWVIFFSQNVQVKIDVDFERYDNGPQKNNKQGD
jgi:hypothetical protein